MTIIGNNYRYWSVSIRNVSRKVCSMNIDIYVANVSQYNKCLEISIKKTVSSIKKS